MVSTQGNMDLQKRKTWQMFKTESLILASPLYLLCDLRKITSFLLPLFSYMLIKLNFVPIGLWWESS